MPFGELAAEVATEVRLLRAIQAELAAHAAAREQRYRTADPAQLARSLPGFADIRSTVVVANKADVVTVITLLIRRHRLESAPNAGPALVAGAAL